MRPAIRKTVIKDVAFLNVDDAPVDGPESVQVERVEHQSDRTHDAAARARLSTAVGANVNRLRLAAGLDTDALAERSGVPSEQLSLVESGGGFPGLRFVWRIARALSVPFNSLLDGTILSEASDGDFRIQRATDGQRLGSIGGLESRVLTAPGVGGAPEVYELTLRPGAAEAAEPHGPATCEHIVVTAGRLLLQAGDREAELVAGDAVFFRADVPHRYVNPGGEEVRALLVMVYA